MTSAVPQAYRGVVVGHLDHRFRTSLLISTGLGLAVLLVVLLSPRQLVTQLTVENVPKRFAKLILQKPEVKVKEAAPSVVAVPPRPELAEDVPEPIFTDPPDPVTPPPRTSRTQAPVVVQGDAGKKGREKAREEVTQALAGTSQALDSVVEDLTKSLGKTDRPARSSGRRRPQVRKARGSSESGAGRTQAPTADTDLAGSRIAGSLIEIEGITSRDAASPGGSTAQVAGGESSPYRTDASLLAVVRRYSAGIRFCYDNELKHDAGLQGKLVVSMTVAASGEVVEAAVVQDSVDSERLNDCVLSQIRKWRFPAIADGVTTFRVPFVFRPPE